jgi:hypothetical protein
LKGRKSLTQVKKKNIFDRRRKTADRRSKYRGNLLSVVAGLGSSVGNFFCPRAFQNLPEALAVPAVLLVVIQTPANRS